MRRIIFGCVFAILSITRVFAEDCAFCNQDVLDYQTFYEDDLVLALYTHKPIFPGHCLIIPKRHVERFEMLSDEEMLQIGKVIQKVDVAAKQVFDTSSYLLLQKNGKEAGQTVFHVHFHYVPRKTGDSSTIRFLLNMFMANAKSPISSLEMKEKVASLREVISSN